MEFTLLFEDMNYIDLSSKLMSMSLLHNFFAFWLCDLHSIVPEQYLLPCEKPLVVQRFIEHLYLISGM